MEVKTARQLAEARAAAQGKQVTNCKAAGKNAVRSIDLNTVQEGQMITVPTNYKLYEMPITGSENTYIVFISEEGIQVALGPLTRGARPADTTQEYVRPSGSVVMECQKYATFDEFLDANKGAHWLYKVKTPVETIWQGETSTRNVWTIVYTNAKGEEVATLAESIG